MIIVVKLKLFILTQFGGNRMLGVFWLTTDCNMKCIYCYEGNEKKKMYMNEETIDKAIISLRIICWRNRFCDWKCFEWN